jgi:hypothetical protein
VHRPQREHPQLEQREVEVDEEADAVPRRLQHPPDRHPVFPMASRI